MTGTIIEVLDSCEVEVIENTNPASEAAMNLIVASGSGEAVGEVRMTKEQVAQLYHRLGVVLEPR